MCHTYKKIRQFNYQDNQETKNITSIAYSILTYNNVEQFERLLRAIYTSNNIYCVHVDAKSSEKFKRAIRSIVDCFDNVFVATQLEKVTYASFYRLKADLNCMSDLLNLTRLVGRHKNLVDKRVIDWKYVIQQTL